MTEYLQTIVGFAAEHSGLVYVFAFIMASLEAIAIVGLIVPGAGAIVALGALVPSGAVDFWVLSSVATVGALLGDSISYWLGWRYHAHIKAIWPFNRYPQAFTAGQKFFHAHGGKSVFLGRYVGPVRGTVPLIAGMAQMPLWRFFVASALSAATWSPAHILPGMLVGASLSLTGAVAARLLALGLGLALLLWLAVKLAGLVVRRGVPLLERAEERLAGWARRRKGWLARQVLALLDARRSEVRILALLGVVLIAAAWAFFAIVDSLVVGSPLVQADLAIYNFMQELHSVVADRVMVVVTVLGGRNAAIAVAIAVGLVFVIRRDWRSASYWAAAVGGAALIADAVRMAFHVPRPSITEETWEILSFPSGQATVNMAIYGFLAVMMARSARPSWRTPIAGAAALVVAMIAVARLYLGVQWFSDALGGIAFGSAWCALLAIAYVRHRPPHAPLRTLAAIPLAVWLGIAGFQLSQAKPFDVGLYVAPPAVRTIALSDWWSEDWRDLPAHRIDLAGISEEPLALQWAGRLRVLREQLAAQGWREPAPWSVSTILDRFNSSADAMSLPVLPRLHDGRPPALILIHAGAADHTRWVLRLWPTSVRLSPNIDAPSQRLWVGAASLQRFRSSLAPFGISFTTLAAPPPFDLLRAALPRGRMEDRGGRPPVSVYLAYDPALPLVPPHRR